MKFCKPGYCIVIIEGYNHTISEDLIRRIGYICEDDESLYNPEDIENLKIAIELFKRNPKVNKDIIPGNISETYNYLTSEFTDISNVIIHYATEYEKLM